MAEFADYFDDADLANSAAAIASFLLAVVCQKIGRPERRRPREP